MPGGSTYGASRRYAEPSPQSYVADSVESGDDESVGPHDRHEPKPLAPFARALHGMSTGAHEHGAVDQGYSQQEGGPLASSYRGASASAHSLSWSPARYHHARFVRRVSPPPFHGGLTAVDIFAQAMSFLPLEDIEEARAAAPVFAAAAECVAPQPLPCNDIVFVRWEPTKGGESTSSRGHHRSAPFPWRCLNCGNIATGARRCQYCRTSLANGACRVFLGQLRKDLSGELSAAMIRSLLPEVSILHVESHTNAADGRGKGCAWAYVNSVEDALRITSLHKRVFVDLDADNGEGFWFVRDPALIGHLGAMADALCAARNRPVWLPRQPLVAELPANAILTRLAEDVDGL